MIDLIVLGGVAALFLLALATRRRFGVLGLGLAGGLVLASQFKQPLSQALTGSANQLQPLAPETVATLLLVLSPALLLLAGGPKYSSLQGAVFGATGFVIMALALLINPLAGDVAWIADNASGLVEFTDKSQGLIVALGVIIAVIDMFMAHNPRLASKRKH